MGGKKGGKSVVDNTLQEFGGKREERDGSVIGKSVRVKGGFLENRRDKGMLECRGDSA